MPIAKKRSEKGSSFNEDDDSALALYELFYSMPNIAFYQTVPFFWELHMLLLLLLLITRCGACVIARGNNKKAVFLTGLSDKIGLFLT